MILILLVEDSPTDANLIRQVFLRAGEQEWHLTHVERLEQAIDICCEESVTSQSRFDVVLLDLRLPDSTGLETLTSFRQAVPDIPIIVLTGVENEELGLQAVERGAQDYLVKDEITIQRLLRAIRYAIRRGQLLNQLQESEQSSREALLREQEMNQMKSQFIGMLSHEFRTPMTTIRSSVDLLQSYSDNLTEERRAKYLERMNNAINQMLHLLDEVLFLSRNESGKVKFKPKPLDVEECCREIIEIIQFSTDKYTINFNISGECLQASMDEELLNCIFTNLLSNAVKYSVKNPNINFYLRCQKNKAIFKIQDSGVGIPEEDQAHLFEPFYRASNVCQIQGTGLGLAIVKKCVELHQGAIEIESHVDRGTIVTVTLPLETRVDATPD